MPKPLFTKAGGYRKLHGFTLATLIHLETIRFCKRFIPYRDDPLGKTSGQMIGAARSGRQNIIEGSERASTSRETEIKLTDVARASLAELLGDFEMFLAERNEIPWSMHDSHHRRICEIRLPEFAYTDDTLHDYWAFFHRARGLYAFCLDHDDPAVVANALVVLIQRCMAMLDKQMERLGRDFLDEGGFKERMYTCRTEARDAAAASDSDAPECPQCASPMRKRFPRNGSENSEPFWGCSKYPACRGTRPYAVEKE
ncbi:MAG: four helix bundle suffix domain-containing protein [Candidatus Pacebacteria bacterium]|nr:four helix bundle suffix domain-containing protein [Candidatus Paceibacterota bacterium]